MTGQKPSDMPVDRAAELEIRRLTRRSFAVGGTAAAVGLGSLAWIGSRPVDHGLPWPLRSVLKFNERVAASLLGTSRLAPTFDRALAGDPRVNGQLGLTSNFDLEAWRLRVVCEDIDRRDIQLPLAAVLELPRVEVVVELKCVEGWSQIVHWAGARFSDFVARYGSTSTYVGLTTPDNRYAVGFDFDSIMHPQTLLCHEMNGRPLTAAHGAPLRLISTVKYGFKSLKRIGTIVFTPRRPRDYWAARGYDWYAGL